ncbi:MAG: hypothetical protein AAFX06_22100 [Planctomycetota bacterium]
MPEINLTNEAGRDAVVSTESVSPSKQTRWLDDQRRQARSVRVAKSSIKHDIGGLLAEHGNLDRVSRALVEGDPEIDFENVGRLLSDTSRVYVGEDREMVRNVRFIEVIKNTDGSIRGERPRKVSETNVGPESPIRWSGKFIPKEVAVRKFVFSGKSQLHHINGLTYDFLFAMAKELEERKSLMLLGAGPKSNQPLILRRGGSPYRGFLEGRTQGDRYCLLLHFSNLELKTPEPKDDESDAEDS